jgi:hypothetical protein
MYSAGGGIGTSGALPFAGRIHEPHAWLPMVQEFNSETLECLLHTLYVGRSPGDWLLSCSLHRSNGIDVHTGQFSDLPLIHVEQGSGCRELVSSC